MPNSFSAKFVQKVVSEISGKEIQSQGSIDYLYPGRIRFEVKEGGASLFVSNKKMSWYYTPPFIDGEKGQVQIQSSDNLFLSKFFDSLKNGLKNNELYSVNKKKNQIEIIFNKNISQSVGLKKATFPEVKDTSKVKTLDELKVMILTKNDNKKVTLEFSDFKKDVSFHDSFFIFTPDKNTSVIER